MFIVNADDVECRSVFLISINVSQVVSALTTCSLALTLQLAHYKEIKVAAVCGSHVLGTVLSPQSKLNSYLCSLLGNKF